MRGVDRYLSKSFWRNKNERYFFWKLRKRKQINIPDKSAVNIYIVYKLDTIKSTRNTDFTIQSAFFGAVKITEDSSDSDHNKYSGYGIACDEVSDFSFVNCECKERNNFWC